MVGKRKSPAHFAYNNMIENSPTSFACNSVFVGPNDFKFGTETRFMVFYGAISKFGTNRSYFAWSCFSWSHMQTTNIKSNCGAEALKFICCKPTH